MAMIPFDDRDGLIWYNGEFVDWRDSKVHVLTHGLHYASCVFEGERMYAGQIFKLAEHTERLVKSGKILGFDLPYSVDELNVASHETCVRNGIQDGYIRPVAWRGSEMMGVSAQHNRINVSKAAGLYMICTMSKHDAERDGYDDALMLDYRGQVAEATGANIFLIIDGKIHTPTPDCFLDGITRRTVIALAKARGYEVIERVIMLEDFEKAQEVFLTGTAAEVTPVSEIGPYKFTPGDICKNMMADYDIEVRKHSKAAAAE